MSDIYAKLSRIRITGTPQGLGTQLFIDDCEVLGVRSIAFKVAVDQSPILTIEIVAAEVELDGHAVVTRERAK